MCNSAAHNSRPNRESVSKRLGKVVAAALRLRDGNACLYCGATEATSGAKLQLDHLTPRSQGGADAATNLVLACRACNASRQDLSLGDWSRKAAATRGLTFTARGIRAHARRSLHTVSA